MQSLAKLPDCVWESLGENLNVPGVGQATRVAANRATLVLLGKVTL